MKPSPLSLNRLFLLVTTMFFAPGVAIAQDAQPTTPVESEITDDGSEIVVLGRFIPEPMRETSEVATFLSAEDLSRQGDDNAALALTRLTGLTVAQGRFVYVRGLGDRYSSALLNGSPLPSPEPLRRQVPLDLFPSNILDGATVQKTFSPNYPGEFGGGIIDLRTLRVPTEPFLTLKLGTGGNTETWGRRGIIYYGESSDWSGVADGVREMPEALRNAISRNVRIQQGSLGEPGFTPSELEAIGESFTNSPLTVLQRDDTYPDFELESTAGTSFDMGRFNIGLVAVGGYDSAFRTREAERVTVVADNAGSDFDAVTTTWDVVVNGFGSATLGWDQNQIALTGLIVRSSTKYAQYQQGFNENVAGGEVYRESTAWYERQLASLQLAGEHEIGDFDLDWRGAFAQSTREAPYERSITYVIPTGGVATYSEAAGANETNFSDLTDEVGSAGIDGAYTLALSDQRDAVISGGLAWSNTIRWNDTYSFGFQLRPNSTPADELQEIFQMRPDYLFSPDNIDPQRFEIIETLNPDANYKGRLTVQGAYLASDVEIMPLLRAALGVRYEDATQVVNTFTRYPLPANTQSAAPVLIENAYWLPAATVTWNFAEDLQMRLGYSQTIARPQFRELAFTPYTDPETDRTYQGNPYLMDSEFQNYDARLEYYFGRDRFVTGGVFYKQIENPIEEVLLSTGSSTLTRFVNAPEATLYGAEVDFRMRFEAPFETPFLSDVEYLFGANYTYTYSEVSAEGNVINVAVDPVPAGVTPPTVPATNFIEDGSALQGTPEHIANLQFGLETDASRLTLLVGYVSERISRRGLAGLATVYEDPGVNLDLVFSRDFVVGGAELTFGLSGRNLLGEAHEEYQESDVLGRTEFNTYDRGQSFSISLAAKL